MLPQVELGLHRRPSAGTRARKEAVLPVRAHSIQKGEQEEV